MYCKSTEVIKEMIHSSRPNVWPVVNLSDNDGIESFHSCTHFQIPR